MIYLFVIQGNEQKASRNLFLAKNLCSANSGKIMLGEISHKSEFNEGYAHEICIRPVRKGTLSSSFLPSVPLFSV